MLSTGAAQFSIRARLIGFSRRTLCCWFASCGFDVGMLCCKRVHICVVGLTLQCTLCVAALSSVQRKRSRIKLGLFMTGTFTSLIRVFKDAGRISKQNHVLTFVLQAFCALEK